MTDAFVWIDGEIAARPHRGGDATVEQRGCQYLPRLQVMRQGARLRVVQADPVLHNIHGWLGDKTVFNYAQTPGGAPLPIRIKRPGLYRLVDDIHAGKRGYVLASPHRYAVVTDADGGFTFADVPAGSYTLRVWHEVLGAQQGQLTVAAGQAHGATILYTAPPAR